MSKRWVSADLLSQASSDLKALPIQMSYRFRTSLIPLTQRRGMATSADHKTSTSQTSGRKAKKEGDVRAIPLQRITAEEQIGDVFSSLKGEAEEVLPDSYIQLKRSIIGNGANQDALRRSWASLTNRLASVVQDVEERQQAASYRTSTTGQLADCSVSPKWSMTSSSVHLRRVRWRESRNAGR